ncbi:MAG: ABC transporter substrate-binding protein [Microthrixaceae bacterium]
MKRSLVMAIIAIAVLGAACGAQGGSAGKDPDTSSTTTAGGKAVAKDASFGDLQEDICGPGEFSVNPSEAGLGTDKLYLGVANDRSAEIRPGLNKVLYDSSVAFAGWCNEQGGIGGLPIEIVDIDAGVFNVEAAMTKACSSVFALVGGGLVQDALEFSNKAGSDFHQCGMIDIPGFAVSVEKADSNGQVQPVPNPGGTVATTWFQDFSKLFPDEAAKWAVAWGQLPSLEVVKTKYTEAAASVDAMNNLGEVSYPPAGVSDWTPYAQRVIGTGAESLSFVGEVDNLNSFLIKAREQGWKGTPLLETNMYDQKLIKGSGPAAEGAVVRMGLHSLEEADKWPAIQQYIDINKKYQPGGELGALGIQSLSAWLLFATSANQCGAKNKGVLTRTCILEQAAAVEEWTGGGLHSPQNPAASSEAVSSPCNMLLIVQDGEFVRLYPKLNGEGDDVDGFHCPKDGVIKVTAEVGEGKVDPDRPI